MARAPESLVGKALEWTGVHHSETGDFKDISTHTVNYESDSHCYVTANGALVGEAGYVYKKLDDDLAICIYRPTDYQGRNDVVLNAMFDFRKMKDRGVLTAGGAPFAVADGDIVEVPSARAPSGIRQARITRGGGRWRPRRVPLSTSRRD